MKHKMPMYLFALYCLWALLLVVSILITLNTKDTKICRYYNEKVEAANLSKEFQEAIKKYELDNGIPIVKEDIYQSGMLGTLSSYITTTSGALDAKKTSINPDFASVAIDMFKEAGMSKGDEIGCTFSGSFPAINLSVLAAIQVFELKSTVMVSIGASTYGANNPNFNFFDMTEYLTKIGLLKVKIDYVSLGGGNDTGNTFDDVTGKMSKEEMENTKNAIINRIKASDSTFINISDFEENINYRLNAFKKSTPNMKLFVNVGGNTISIGVDSEGFISRNGLITPTTKDITKKIVTGKTGLIDRFLIRGLYVAQFLNIKGLASKYSLPYNPTTFNEIGTSAVYYETSYNLALPIASIVISIGLLGLIIYLRKNGNYEV